MYFLKKNQKKKPKQKPKEKKNEAQINSPPFFILIFPV